jgi:hypothetical protein
MKKLMLIAVALLFVISCGKNKKDENQDQYVTPNGQVALNGAFNVVEEDCGLTPELQPRTFVFSPQNRGVIIQGQQVPNATFEQFGSRSIMKVTSSQCNYTLDANFSTANDFTGTWYSDGNCGGMEQNGGFICRVKGNRTAGGSQPNNNPYNNNPYNNNPYGY